MSGIVKYGGGFIALCVVIAMFGSKDKPTSNYVNPSPSGGAASAALPAASPPELIHSNKLIAAYDKNEVAADNTYKGRRLRVVGKIRSIGKDITDDPFVTIGEAFSGVNCYFDSEHAGVIAMLSKGQSIVFEGDCSGLTIGSVILRHCSIPSEAQLRADYPEMAKKTDADSSKKKRRRRATDDDE